MSAPINIAIRVPRCHGQADPRETVDVASNAAYAATLATWRARLVAQFEHEQRGEGWVQDGKLMRRQEGQVIGPNYPPQYAEAARARAGELDAPFRLAVRVRSQDPHAISRR